MTLLRSKVETSDECARVLFECRPKAESVEAGVIAQPVRKDAVLNLFAWCRWATREVPHHLRIAVEVVENIDVILGELPKDQSFGLKVDVHPEALSPKSMESCAIEG